LVSNGLVNILLHMGIDQPLENDRWRGNGSHLKPDAIVRTNQQLPLSYRFPIEPFRQASYNSCCQKHQVHAGVESMSQQEYGEAVRDFQRARQQASLQKMMARWTGKSLDLLSFEEVREQLNTHGKMERGLRQIPLDAIVGSVGRYRDFSRAFLPLHDGSESRWAGVKAAQVTKGLPPISVYQIGEVYFVLDGNHRVSVARQLGSESIEAYVTEVQTKIPLTPDDEPADVILKAEYSEFLSQTRLDELRPEVSLSLTSPGKYPLLLEHIEVHRYYMGVEKNREIPYEEAVTHWCDQVYLPTVRLIWETGLIRDFPERTEADMYAWLADHRAEIEQLLGWEVSTEKAVSDMATTFGSYKPHGLVSRALRAALPGSLEIARTEGKWRRQRLKAMDRQQLLNTLLVPFSGSETGWQALDQAILIAQREGTHIYGLFAVANLAEQSSIVNQAFQAEFENRCTRAGVTATFIMEEGDFDKLVSKRGRWADMMVLRSTMTSAADGRPDSVFRRIVRRASGPLLVVPDEASPLNSALLAYDERRESDDALYMAAQIGSQWQIPVTLLHVNSNQSEGEKVAAKATAYLAEQGVKASVVIKEADVTEMILATAEEEQSDLIIMGSPNLSRMFELVLGGTVKEMLKKTQNPLLLCR
jgi:nucleotide-binding universal stress UspA family protein